MIGNIIFIGYILVATFTARLIGRAWNEDPIMTVDDNFELAATIMISVIIGLFWPVVLPYMTIRRLIGGTPADAAGFIFGESRNRKMQRLEKEAAQREQHIHELEDQLGIPRLRDSA